MPEHSLSTLPFTFGFQICENLVTCQVSKIFISIQNESSEKKGLWHCFLISKDCGIVTCQSVFFFFFQLVLEFWHIYI